MLGVNMWRLRNDDDYVIGSFSPFSACGCNPYGSVRGDCEQVKKNTLEWNGKISGVSDGEKCVKCFLYLWIMCISAKHFRKKTSFLKRSLAYLHVISYHVNIFYICGVVVILSTSGTQNMGSSPSHRPGVWTLYIAIL
jgi:hypothetical protein